MRVSTPGAVTADPGGAVPAPAPGAIGTGRHYMRYSGATVLTMAAGLVSFPVLTRLLDNTQYGILGYYETWVLMLFAVVKLGSQHAILRMYPYGGDAAALTRFTTNLLFLPLAVSTGLWALGFGIYFGISWWYGIEHSPVLWVALSAIPLMVFISQVDNTLRASERSRLLTTTKVTARWTELAIVLVAVIWVQRSALSVYGGRVATMALVAGFYAWWVHRHLHASRQTLDLGTYKASVVYGLPLVANEIAGAALVSIDRFMLKHMLDDYAAVGIYTIGYALAMQLGVIVNGPFWDAYMPALNKSFTLEGEAAVRAVKARVLVPVTYACVGLAAAIAASGSDVLQMLSGPGKAASGEVFAWVGAIYALTLMLDFAGYGLLLYKRSGTVMVLMLLSLGLNVGLNLLWIPEYGYMGAIYATAISYLALGVSRCVMCPRGLLQLPDRRTVLVAVGAAALFLGVLELAGIPARASHWSRAFLAGGVWLGCYVLPVLVLDGRMRRLLAGVLPRRR